MTIAKGRISNTLSMPPPSMIVEAAPAPLMVRLPLISKSPVAAASSPIPTMVKIWVPAGRVIVEGPARALASMMAARRVHFAEASAQAPSPGFISTVSAGLLTMKFAACAVGAKAPARIKTATRIGLVLDTGISLTGNVSTGCNFTESGCIAQSRRKHGVVETAAKKFDCGIQLPLGLPHTDSC